MKSDEIAAPVGTMVTVEGHVAAGATAARAPTHLGFGAFTLELSRGILLRGEQLVPLRRQAFDTLRYLAERSGQIVSKNELIAAVWPSPPADPDGSLAQCIKEIRKALGDESRWMIRTVSGTGYEFKAEVEEHGTLASVLPSATTGGGAAQSGIAGRLRALGQRPILVGAIAVLAGFVLALPLMTYWTSVVRRPAVDTVRESYLYWPPDTILTGEEVTAQTPDGRWMTCIGGMVGIKARRCWYGKGHPSLNEVGR
jgi:DNA-binding winged helix-turn-helix (wHTH) protein